MSDIDLKKISILIPSLDPDINMVNYINELVSNDVRNIIVINDGSKSECFHFFEDVAKHSEVTVINHEVNKGKGRALKTGIEYIINNLKDVVGIVTADADGQHSCKDTIKVAQRLLETKNIIFGTRNFNEDIVPFKSRNGNKITTIVFKLLYGETINDTQTGLRGLPIDFAKECLDIKGERYEYEIAMLIKAVVDNRKIIEEPIDTIYLNDNRASHFNAFSDSFKIYCVMFKQLLTYSASSLLTSLIDLIIYAILINTIFDDPKYLSGIMWSTIIARIVSCTINYILNKKTVFKSDKNVGSTLIKYTVLAVVQMLASGYFTTLLYSLLKINTTIIKVIVDFILFFVSYHIQKRWVFK